MRIVMVIPTYNERENIARLIAELEAVFVSLPHEMSILIVDDNSPDGTIDAVRECQARWSNLHALQGAKQGLGAAYVRGIRHALDVLGAEAICGMDADFSHKPSDLPRLLAALDLGADFVIGSRYAPGGRIPPQWALYRRLNSRVGNMVARYVAGIYRVRDCTAGFRVIRASVIRRIDLEQIGVKGYAFLVALLHAAAVGGAKVVEVPVEFIDRTAGESKLGPKDIAEFIINAAWLRFQASRVFIRFCVIGLSGVVVNLASLTLLLHLGMNKYIASPIAVQLSIFTNFLGNNYWTFSRRLLKGGVRARGLRYNAVSLLALAISYATFVALSRLFPTASAQWCQLLAIVPATLVNYFLNSYWTFRDSSDAGSEHH